MNKDIEVIITGHKGFIGQCVFNHFVNLGYTCRGYDIKEDNDIRTCSMSSCDLVIHLAALAGVRRSHEMPQEYWSVNVDGSKRVFDHAMKWGAKIMYASSSSSKQWWTSPYAATKKAMEAIAPEGSIGMRFHTVYGYWSRPDMMYRKLLDDRAEYVTEHTRDFTHVNDVVSAIDALYNSNFSGIVDVGTGKQVKVTDVAIAARRCLPVKQVTGEQEFSEADTTILKSLGWSPKHHVLDEMNNDIIQKNKMAKLSINR